MYNIKLVIGRIKKITTFSPVQLPLFLCTCKMKSGNLIGYDHTHLPLFLKKRSYGPHLSVKSKDRFLKKT